MTKPVITTRATKGSALTWTEGDTNLENLRDATITVKADTGGTDVVSDLNGTVTLVAGTNVTITGDNTAKTVTIAASGGSTSPAGSNQQIQFNNSGSFGASSSLYYDGTSLKCSSGNIESLYSNGDEGGEFRLAKPQTNTTLAGDVTIDIYQNKLRIFENGGSSRGAYIDLTAASGSVGSNLLGGGSSALNDLTDVVITAAATNDVLVYNGTDWVDTAASSLTVGTASVGSTVTLTADNTTNATNYPLFANAATGNLSPRTDTGFTYNPSTGALTATSFIGNVNISTNTGNSADTTLYPVMVATSSTGAQALHIDSTNYQFDATNNVLSVGAAGDASASIKLFSTGTQSVSLKAPGSLNTALTFTLPGTTGTSGQVLSTNGSGTLSWATAGGGTVTSISGTGTVSGITLTGSVTTSGSLTLGGTLDLSSPPAIGGTTANTGAFTTLTASTFSASSINNTVIGGVTPKDGSFNNLNVKSGNYLFLYNAANTFYNAFHTSASQAVNVAYTLPTADGSANQVLKTDGAGNLSWTTVGGIALTDLSVGTENTASNDGAISYNNTTGVFTYTPPTASGIGAMVAATPQLGGDLDLVSYKITTTTVNGNILIEPNGTGDVYLRSDRVYVNEPNVDANITTDGTGDLIFSTNAGASSGLFRIYDGANGNIVITPNGTGKTQVSAINYNEGALYDLGTTGGTIAPDVANGNVQKITLNSALTLNAFTNPVAGQSLTLIIYGGTAYTSITSTMKFAGGVKTLTGTAGCIDILSVYYDGTNYFASLGKGFA